MSEIIKKGLESLINIKKDKREYKEYLERLKALPADYSFVYEKMTGYMWEFYCGGDGYDIMEIQSNLLELFEAGSAEKKDVLEITGENVAAFCDELLRSINIHVETVQEKLNREIREKLENNTK